MFCVYYNGCRGHSHTTAAYNIIYDYNNYHYANILINCVLSCAHTYTAVICKFIYDRYDASVSSIFIIYYLGIIMYDI